MPPKTTVPMACWLAAPAPPAVEQRHHSQDEGKGGHDDGPEAPPGGLNGGLGDGHALGVHLPGEFHDQDGVLAGQGDHQHQPHLGVEIIVEAPDHQGQEDPHQGQGHHQDDGRRAKSSFHRGRPAP